MPNPRPLALLALAVVLAGCVDEQPKPPAISEAMPNLPLPPQATVVSRESGSEALQITFRSAMGMEGMTSYYRDVLNRGIWTLVNDARSPDGAVTLYAERNGPPLWVTIRPVSGGTTVTLAGAVSRVDSAATGQPQQ